jgi:hypothetical protein
VDLRYLMGSLRYIVENIFGSVMSPPKQSSRDQRESLPLRDRLSGTRGVFGLVVALVVMGAIVLGGLARSTCEDGNGLHTHLTESEHVSAHLVPTQTYLER